MPLPPPNSTLSINQNTGILDEKRNCQQSGRYRTMNKRE
jgi:hypothetical protein